jgi:four helix bundle protein
MQDFRNLKVWQRAHELAFLVYKLTADFPREELFGLRNSLRKTSVDIPAYIAEGCGKSSDPEFQKCVAISLALANRLEYYALIATDLQMLNTTNHKELHDTTIVVQKMLSTLSQKLH